MFKLNKSIVYLRREEMQGFGCKDPFAFLPFIILHLLLPSALSLSFSIPQFDDNTKDILCEGDAKPYFGAVQMTMSSIRVGRFTYTEPVYLWDSSNGKVADFSTNFTFTIIADDNETYSDGLAFFIAPVGYGIPPNSDRNYLGLFNDTTKDSRENQIITVEFDTYSNKEYDPPNPHVGININAISSAATADWDVVSVYGRPVHCWIKFNSTTKNLSVSWTLDENMGKPSLFHVIDDITKILPSRVSIGFSAATGDVHETHAVHSWEFSSNLKPNSSRRRKIPTSIVVSVACLMAFVIGAITTRTLVKRIRSREAQRSSSSLDIDIEIQALPKKFTYKELVTATNGFADDKKLGQGGSGHVYKGTLNDLGCFVAIKRIIPESRDGEKFFTNEVKVISRLIHQNLVKFIGWCHENGEFLLVYDYMPNGSLDSHLFGNRKTIPWEVRYKIVLGLASALHYLHEEAGQCVIHRDIKAANVLLDIDFTTKLGDFGVAKLVDPQLRTQLTGVVGTYGYLAPEYMNEGRVSKGSDIYSFGIVALEIACGRKTYLDGDYRMPLLKWVWRLYLSGNVVDAGDERLNMVFNEEEMECLLIVGLWCTHPNDKERPSVGEVIKVLKFEAPLPELSPDMHDQHHYVPSLQINPFTSSKSSSSKYQSA